MANDGKDCYVKTSSGIHRLDDDSRGGMLAWGVIPRDVPQTRKWATRERKQKERIKHPLYKWLNAVRKKMYKDQETKYLATAN